MNDASPFRLPAVTGRMVESFTGLICDGLEDEAARMVEQLMAQGCSAESLMMQLLAPAARRMGEFWCEDRCDFVEVTLGMARLQQMVRRFRLPASTRGHQLGHALLLPVPSEQHTFGLRVVEEHLLRAGWQVTTVLKVAETDITAIVAGEIFDFVGFSVTSERLLPTLRSAIACVRSSSRNQNVRIVVGGVLFDGRRPAPAELDVDAIVMDAEEAVNQASEWAGLAGVE